MSLTPQVFFFYYFTLLQTKITSVRNLNSCCVQFVLELKFLPNMILKGLLRDLL